MEIIVNILVDPEDSAPELDEQGRIIIPYTARRGTGGTVHRTATPMPGEQNTPEEINAYVAAQALEEAGGISGDYVTVFGGVVWRGQPGV